VDWNVTLLWGQIYSPTKKRGSLSTVIIEAMMSVHLNKSLVEKDITKFKDLGRDWETYIPKLCDGDFSDGYYQNIKQFDQDSSMFDAMEDGESSQNVNGSTPSTPNALLELENSGATIARAKTNVYSTIAFETMLDMEVKQVFMVK
jgi:hypothetical protein